MTISSAEQAVGEVAGAQTGEGQRHAGFWGLTLGAIGVVYGDIGTSPLYAVKESVLAAVGHGNPATHEAVLGILSLIIWALLLVVTLKYVVILLRADNHGEGGTLALMALANKAVGSASLPAPVATRRRRPGTRWRVPRSGRTIRSRPA